MKILRRAVVPIVINDYYRMVGIIDFQLFNSYMIHREMHSRHIDDYREFFLRLAQSLCSESLKSRPVPMRIGDHEFTHGK